MNAGGFAAILHIYTLFGPEKINYSTRQEVIEKNLKLTIRDGDIIEMERIQSLHNPIDDGIFSYLLRLDSRADTYSLTPTERRHRIERARRAGAERAGTGNEPPKSRKRSK